jgi:hypothetical protein
VRKIDTVGISSAHGSIRSRHFLRYDFEEVARLVSYATNEPIGAVNVPREGDRLQADVTTSTSVSTHALLIEKRGSAWYRVKEGTRDRVT